MRPDVTGEHGAGRGGSVCPETAASAAATTSTGLRPALDVGEDLLRGGGEVGEELILHEVHLDGRLLGGAVITCSPVGGLMDLNFTPVSRMMFRRRYFSRGVNIAMAEPCLFARPVRPQRCTNDSLSLGSS